MKTLSSTLFPILLISALSLAQETTVQLPTNDPNSSFNITKNNGTSVFKVEGDGRMSGDGSGLSNVKPVVAYAQGNQSVIFHEGAIPGLNLYEAQIMREVTISCPGPGIIFAQASGYCDWESIREDLARIWFHPHPTVTPTDSWETPDFHNLRIVSDYECADSSDQFTSWSITKTYTVGSAQDYTVKICADKPFSYSKFLIGDVVLQLMFFPTGGTGPSQFKFASSEITEDMSSFSANSLDGSFTAPTDEKEATSDKERISKLESELEILNQKLDRLLEKNGSRPNEP